MGLSLGMKLDNFPADGKPELPDESMDYDDDEAAEEEEEDSDQ